MLDFLKINLCGVLFFCFFDVDFFSEKVTHKDFVAFSAHDDILKKTFAVSFVRGGTSKLPPLKNFESRHWGVSNP